MAYMLSYGLLVIICGIYYMYIYIYICGLDGGIIMAYFMVYFMVFQWLRILYKLMVFFMV